MTATTTEAREARRYVVDLLRSRRIVEGAMIPHLRAVVEDTRLDLDLSAVPVGTPAATLEAIREAHSQRRAQSVEALETAEARHEALEGAIVVLVEWQR